MIEPRPKLNSKYFVVTTVQAALI